MVSLQLYSRGEAKQQMDILFTHITNQNYNQARRTAEKLKNCLLKYFQTRGTNCNNIYSTFDEFDYLLKRCSPGRIKQQLCFDFLQRITTINQLAVNDPVDRLKQLYEDLRHAYLNLNNRENFDTILDCFDEVRTLKTALQNAGGTPYNYYTTVLQEIGKCESILLHVSMTGKLDNKKDSMEAFKNLFASIQKVIAPPVMIKITKQDVEDHIKKGGKIEELSEATRHSEDELQAMLSQINLGEGEE